MEKAGDVISDIQALESHHYTTFTTVSFVLTGGSDRTGKIDVCFSSSFSDTDKFDR
jgi:hypothetical protein